MVIRRDFSYPTPNIRVREFWVQVLPNQRDSVNTLLSTDTPEATHLKIKAVPKCMQLNHLWFTLFFFFFFLYKSSLTSSHQSGSLLPLTLWSLLFVSTGSWVQEIQSALSSVQFSHSVLSNSLWSHGLQHTRPPCPSPNPRVYSNSCPLSWWCHPTTSSSVIPFSSCLQSVPALGSFQMSQFFKSGGQTIGVSASTSVLPMNTQDRSPLGWTGWISLQSKGLPRVFSPQFRSIIYSALSFL